jgi:hypothetical protein
MQLKPFSPPRMEHVMWVKKNALELDRTSHVDRGGGAFGRRLVNIA